MQPEQSPQPDQQTNASDASAAPQPAVISDQVPLATPAQSKHSLRKVLLIVGGVILCVVTLLGVLLALTLPATLVGVQRKARDTEVTIDINYLHGQLEAFYKTNSYYPAKLEELKVSDSAALTPPERSQTSYQYRTAPENCTKCDKYILSSQLEDGTAYVKKSLN